TVLYPDIAYPTYEMGARLAGLRAVPVPLDDRWLLDLTRVDEADAARALLVWVNEPGNPTGSSGGGDHLRAVADWARSCGAIVASDECYAEFSYDPAGAAAPPATILAHGHDRTLAVHSLSKRSNMAGLRAGFVAGDPAVVSYLGEVRKHAGLMTPAPVQAAAAAALGDDRHVDEQRARYARRRADALDALGAWGLLHDGGPSTFYLWLRSAASGEDGWSIARRLAERGLLAAPGDLYGPGGAAHVRLSLTQTDDRLALAFDRLTKERV
ncbi:MAG TPA: aminotransferase class I/II-fold pyridoxal phosphate-dependent enzyme, partial [Acidimicrobiia bacterium]|nr:aminotransferase class I/II-fold pyridoxal phosphate-dependent enzyme [Acidimicrobiia bacterium]